MNTRTVFLEELNRIREGILSMASKIDEDLDKALRALENDDKDLAKEVKANDKLINAMQLKIEDEAVILIATQSPVAGDLRELIAVTKITGDLERIGDHAVHLAKAAGKLSGVPSIHYLPHIEKMAETSREMLRSAISAFTNQDSAAARNAAAMDSVIDAEHKLLTEETLSLMKESPKLIKKAVRLLNTSNHLERMGDHVTNICEAIVYMVECRHEELDE